MPVDDFRNYVYGLSRECFVRHSLTTELLATLEFQGSQCVGETTRRLLEMGFKQISVDDLKFTIQLTWD